MENMIEVLTIAAIMSLFTYGIGWLHGMKYGARAGAETVFESLHAGGLSVEQIEAALIEAKRRG